MSEERDPVVEVSCREAACATRFPLPSRWLGRNVYCPRCGRRLTARPAGAETAIQRLRQQAPRGGHSPVRRLPLVAVIDNVRSLWNVGSIFRSADACGVAALSLCGITGHPPREAISKTALGAEDVVPWRWAEEVADEVERWAAEGYCPVGLESSDDAVPIEAFAWPERVCLVVGNEVSGVSAEALRRCERLVSIRMLGVKESLNVAVAFGIAAHRAGSALIQS